MIGRKLIIAGAIAAAAGCSFSTTAGRTATPPPSTPPTTLPDWTQAGDATGAHPCTATLALQDQSPTDRRLARATGMWLPDPKCTPGATNPAVTQANIASTICKRGWASSVRPPVSYTEPLKRKGVRAYGYIDKHLGDYEEDHLVPLELGGAPTDPRNLWPEPYASPNLKDDVENSLHAFVCRGQMTLAEAQHDIETDWVAWA